MLSREFYRSPVLASRLGLTDHDERLDDLSADAFVRRDAEDAEMLARVETIGEAGPPGVGGLDAVGLNAQLCRAPGGEQIKKNIT